MSAGPGTGRGPAWPEPGSVHVHWVRLDRPLPPLGALLSDGERRRAAAHRRAADRLRSAAAAALLRTVAGRSLGLAPRAVDVRRSCDGCGQAHGRPRIAGFSRMQLSVTHSGGCVAVALALDMPVGIDVESVDIDLPADEIFRVAGETGAAALAGSAAGREARTDAVRRALTLWTRKEAVLKATGAGLAGRAASVRLGGPGSRPRVSSWPAAPALVGQLRLRPLQPPPAHVATLAVVGPPRTVVEQDSTDLLVAVAEEGARSPVRSVPGWARPGPCSSQGPRSSSPAPPAGSAARWPSSWVGGGRPGSCSWAGSTGRSPRSPTPPAEPRWRRTSPIPQGSPPSPRPGRPPTSWCTPPASAGRVTSPPCPRRRLAGSSRWTCGPRSSSPGRSCRGCSRGDGGTWCSSAPSPARSASPAKRRTRRPRPGSGRSPRSSARRRPDAASGCRRCCRESWTRPSSPGAAGPTTAGGRGRSRPSGSPGPWCARSSGTARRCSSLPGYGCPRACTGQPPRSTVRWRDASADQRLRRTASTAVRPHPRPPGPAKGASMRTHHPTARSWGRPTGGHP
ncbi:4'-phosphopantetheinyl transferase [Blastococcus saxobsidens DD2]|uniref:4'-phosphopantetheinyl transferase n=1 Tax=Blastococcus saxobsidens (strain DD2) TaxID=1146883 RepID=H6RL64_BLASD|nr:4'-phosphopantetheinyl transferase [Blastococcus saxobsidens DD2]